MGSKEKLLGAITTLYPTYGDKNIVYTSLKSQNRM